MANNIIDIRARLLQRSEEGKAREHWDRWGPLTVEFALSWAFTECNLLGLDGDPEEYARAIVDGLLGSDAGNTPEFHNLVWRPFVAWLLAKDEGLPREYMSLAEG